MLKMINFDKIIKENYETSDIHWPQILTNSY